MTVRVYRSVDNGAPALTNALGSVIGVLDACLVNGYGTAGVGTGVKAAAGWSKLFSGTNKAVYRPGAGTRFPMRVDHSAAAYYCRVYGAESFSDVDTGTALFPTAAQLAGGVTWQLTTNTAANRLWLLVADERTMYLFVGVDGLTTAAGAWMGGMFGDFYSYKVGDAFNSIVIGAATQSTGNGTPCRLADIGVATGHYVARQHSQAGSSYNFLKAIDNYSITDIYGRSLGNSNSVPAYPCPMNNEFFFSQALVSETVVRGKLRGLWGSIFQSATLKSAGLQRGDTVNGGAALAGRTMELLFLSDYAGNPATSTACAHVLVETTDTWDTN